MRANLQVHAYFNVILVEQLQDTICNREDALLAAAEEIRVAKVEKEHSKVKKSPKSKTAVKRKKASSSKVAKRLSFEDLGVAQPVLKKSRVDYDMGDQSAHIKELEKMVKKAENRSNFLEGQLESLKMWIMDKNRKISNYLTLLNMKPKDI